MTARWTFRTVPRLLPGLLVGSLLGLLGTSAAEAALYYKAKTTVDKGKGDTLVEAWVDGEKARIVFLESEMPQMSPGSYLVTSDGGKNVFLVDPKKKTYSHWDIAALMNVMEGMSGLVDIEVSEPEVTKLDEGDGGQVAGVATRYYKYRTTYDMTVKVMGMKRGSSVVNEQELWVTDAYDLPAMGVWLTKGGRSTGHSSLDKLITAEMEKVKGLPLKTVTVSTTEDGKGRQNVSRTTTEVTELRESSDPEGGYGVPEGYEEVPLLPGMEGGEDGKGGNPFKDLFGGGRR